VLDDAPRGGGQAKPEALLYLAEARAVVLNHHLHPAGAGTDRDPHRAGRSRRARRVVEKIGGHAPQNNRMNGHADRLDGVNEAYFAGPGEPLGGGGFLRGQRHIRPIRRCRISVVLKPMPDYLGQPLCLLDDLLQPRMRGHRKLRFG
jgi:hypothetical protein